MSYIWKNILVKPLELEDLFLSLEKCVNILDSNKKVTLKEHNDYIYDYDKKELKYKNKNILLNKKEMIFSRTFNFK